jgi:two-component system CheB/CheR fusion protein
MNPGIHPAVEEWLPTLLETTSDFAVIVLERDGTIVSWLGASQRIFGYGANEVLGADFALLFTPEDRARGLDKQERALASTAGRSEDDRWHLRKDGSLFWGSGVLEAVHDRSGSIVALCKVLRDRTDVRSQLDTFQNRLAAKDEELSRRIHALISVGHELRNLLAPMKNAAAVLARSNDPTVKVRSVDVLHRQLAAMAKLVDDLSDSVHAATRVTGLHIEAINVQVALQRAAEDLQPLAAQREQELVLTLPDVPLTIDADPVRLNQMLANLLSNASKFTPAGGWISLSATLEADMVVVRVEDNGAGISGELLPTIFDLFTRDESTAMPSGLGVGLAVVKNLATLHGGSIEARCPGPGQGQRVRPQDCPRAAPESDQPADSEARWRTALLRTRTVAKRTLRWLPPFSARQTCRFGAGPKLVRRTAPPAQERHPDHTFRASL